MKTILLSKAVGLAVCVISVPMAAEADLSGSYQCVGDSGTGGEYHGTAQITKEGDVYALKYQIGEKQRYTAWAIQEGGVLSAALRNDNDEKYTGVAVYRIQEGGKLSGRWSTSAMGGKTYTESLIAEK
jgi:hypothetical protein